MTAESGIILGVGIALVLLIIVRRFERKRHEQKMKVLQDRIARSEQAAKERRQGEQQDEQRSR